VSVALRPAHPGDAGALSGIVHDAFAVVAAEHGYPTDWPDPTATRRWVGALLAHPRIHGVIAEGDGETLGASFSDERNPVVALGPVAVRPDRRGRGVGRALVRYGLDRARDSGAVGVRLVQAAYNTASFSLYASFGFEARVLLACCQGRPEPSGGPAGHAVRLATADDLEVCNRLCQAVHGHDRGGETADAVRRGRARLVERDGRITAYATGVGFTSHGVGETSGDLQALLAATSDISGPGVLIPAGDPLLRWCLGWGLRVVQLMTLMTVGPYQPPRGAWWPSVGY
jgi:predicted N-acetyltransferase YhbS